MSMKYQGDVNEILARPQNAGFGLAGWVVIGPFVKILAGGFEFSSVGIWLSAWRDT
jgi:hypothetical protein